LLRRSDKHEIEAALHDRNIGTPQGPYGSTVIYLDCQRGCIVKLNRSHIVARLAKRTDLLTIDDIELSVSLILAALSDRLAAGDRVELRGFGSVFTIYRKSRLGRNPRTGMGVNVPGKWVPHFKAGKEMRGGVNVRFDAIALALAAQLNRRQATQCQNGLGGNPSRPMAQESHSPRNAAM
jgi:integration host factor subunit beta